MKNIDWLLFSKAFLLSEKGKDPELRMPNMNYYRPEAETPFTINCVIPGADYRNPVVWMKDGEPLDLSKPSFMRVVEGGQSLVFDSIRLAQSGIYTCRVGPEGQSSIVDVRPQSVQGNDVVKILSIISCPYDACVIRKCI